MDRKDVDRIVAATLAAAAFAKSSFTPTADGLERVYSDMLAMVRRVREREDG